ncbi:putative porin [Cupriavidus basilensis]|uniref:Porin n=1 Tax=Cupriavidus basilensis TaxID=68895 RepID=A0ABT6AMR0_9BURK|nr:putative porin [Cupriavidus basilensis]MDF3833910.1 putative porin [Cupriavidus basilensis]
MNHPAIPQRHSGRGAAWPAGRASQQPAPARKTQILAAAMAIALLGASAAGHAQSAAPAESSMVRLIRSLIQSGALNKDAGEALLAQAQTEAMAAQQAQRLAAAPAAGGLRPEPGDVRVPYISETVRDEIRDEVKGQVMAQAKAEGWAAPNETPEWTKRIHVEGDIRVRNESRFFSGGNSDIAIDWAAINQGSGFDVNPNTNLSLPPLLNTRQNRPNILRARARVGILADISDSTHAGVRLATGNDDSPVSTNQTLGGGLAKKNVWLDQGWLSYKPAEWVNITGGRFGNPFVSSDLLFSNDLNFDGLAAQFEKALPQRDVTLFGTLGLVPLEYSSDSFPSRSQNKMGSEKKWLLGAQAGAEWKVNSDNRLRGAVAYYDFRNVSGRLSQPCALYAGADGCSTDWSRPAFMQKGNTLMLLRNIALNPLDPAGTPQPQFVGLASKFQLLDLNMRWETKVAGRYGLRLDANYVRNLAYDENGMFTRANGGIVNNFGGSGGTTRADFKSGGNAYMFQATLGKPSPSARGDWNVLAGYKRIEPDAMPDAYNDPTFHLGGTNARGYYVSGSYAIDKNTWVTGRWTSTKEVFGPPLAIDILQVEINTRF